MNMTAKIMKEIALEKKKENSTRMEEIWLSEYTCIKVNMEFDGYCEYTVTFPDKVIVISQDSYDEFIQDLTKVFEKHFI